MRRRLGVLMERFAGSVTRWVGTSLAFSLAALVVVAWAATGPLFGYSDTWQLVINTGTTVVTFLMVFLIQRQQNKEGVAVHLKLNELLASKEGASNRLFDVEGLPEEEVAAIARRFRLLAEIAREQGDRAGRHSVEEVAEERREG
jgi:low affinity Fe/Cu permease